MDPHGIPHVTAGSEWDLFFALGYLHARDRRFQMELLKMDSQGRLRELLGRQAPPAILRLEVFSRAIGFRDNAAAALAALPLEDREVLEAYAKGVNEATTREPAPREFTLLRYLPEPWSPVDCLSILELVSFGFCKNWEQELVRLELTVNQLKTGSSAERALSIWPPRLDLPPHLIGVKPEKDPFAEIPPVAPELLNYLRSLYGGNVAARRRSDPERAGYAARLHPTGARPNDAAVSLERSLDLRFLSNNWAVDGKWTGTGKGAFAMDPHMPYSLPPLTYLTALRLEAEKEEFSVMGAGIPGLPAIPFGTNGKVAWGPTSNWADTTDLYVEIPAPGKPGYYLTETGETAFSVREEIFLIRRIFGYRQESKTFRSTRHGVIVNDFLGRLPADFPLIALRRAGTVGGSLSGLRHLYRSSGVREARAALNGFTALSGHWALADSGGNIGYTGPVALPLRRKSLGTFPVPGWTGAHEWEGFVPAADLPAIENPPPGYLATANNQVVQPESAGYPINFEGDVPHRITRILSLLSEGNHGGKTADRLRAIQMDGADASFTAMRPFLLPVLEGLKRDPDPLTAEAARVLSDWDGMTDPASPAPTIYQSLISMVFMQTMSDEASPDAFDFLLFYFNADPLIFGILADPSNPAWDDRLTTRVETAAEVMDTVFRGCVRALKIRYGRRVEDWSWRKAAPFTIYHAFGSRFAFNSYNRKDLPAMGTASSIFMHKYDRKDPTEFPISYGPALRLVVDLSDSLRCFASIPGGQSGRPDSPRYSDLLPLFLEGKGVDIELDPSAALENAVLSIRLLPKRARQ